jgi:hypothetical protein
MASQLSARALVRRGTSLSTGGIVGLSIGLVAAVALGILLCLPFILKRVRSIKTRRQQEPALAAEMGMAHGSVRRSDVPSPASIPNANVPPPAEGSGDSGHRPVKEYSLDGNSCEDAPAAPAQAQPGGPSPSPRLDLSTYALTSSSPRSGLVQTESPRAMDAPSSFGGPAGDVSPPPATYQSRHGSRRQRKSSKGSIGQAIEDLADRATAVFRRGSTRSQRSAPMTSPVRSGTFDLDDTLAPAYTAPPQLIEDDVDHTTGAAAEYYQGLPMSPPEMGYDYPQQAYSQPETVSPIQTSFASIGALGAVPGGVAFEPKRHDSSNTDFSPLSPISPPIKIEHSFDEQEDVSGLQYAPAHTLSPSTEQDDDTHIKKEFPSSPYQRALVPSPELPAPGTVNPVDLWAPLNANERSHHVLVELDRLENSPPPGSSNLSRDSTPATHLPDDHLSPYQTPLTGIASSPSPAPPLPPQIVEQPPMVIPELQQTFENGEMAVVDIPDGRITPALSMHSGRMSFENTPLTIPGSEYGNPATPASQYAATPSHSSSKSKSRQYSLRKLTHASIWCLATHVQVRRVHARIRSDPQTQVSSVPLFVKTIPLTSYQSSQAVS